MKKSDNRFFRKYAILTFAVCLCLPQLLLAQNDKAKMRLQVAAGTSDFVMKNKNGGFIPTHKSVPTYGLRLAWDMIFIDPYKSRSQAKVPFYFSMGIGAYKRGVELGQVDKGTEGDGFSMQYNPYYVTFSEDFYLKPRIGQFNNRIFFGAGLYLGAAVGGQVKYVGDVPDLDEFENRSIKFGGDAEKEADMRRGEFGGKLAAGVEIGKLILGAELLKNFSNNLPNNAYGEKDLKGRFRSYAVTIGYFF